MQVRNAWEKSETTQARTQETESSRFKINLGKPSFLRVVRTLFFSGTRVRTPIFDRPSTWHGKWYDYERVCIWMDIGSSRSQLWQDSRVQQFGRHAEFRANDQVSRIA